LVIIESEIWFVRLDEGEMWKNVVRKWRKCRGKVEEVDGEYLLWRRSTSKEKKCKKRKEKRKTQL